MNYNTFRNEHYTGDWESIRRMESDDRKEVAPAYRKWSEVYFLNEGTHKMTKQQQDDMYNEVYKPIDDAAKEIAKGNKAIMKSVRSKVSGSMYYGICRYLRELKDGCYHVEFMEYKIVDKPTGEYQQEKGYSKDFAGVWCDQWPTGCEGDSYSGLVYIQISDKEFLKVNYEM